MRRGRLVLALAAAAIAGLLLTVRCVLEDADRTRGADVRAAIGAQSAARDGDLPREGSGDVAVQETERPGRRARRPEEQDSRTAADAGAAAADSVAEDAAHLAADRADSGLGETMGRFVAFGRPKELQGEARFHRVTCVAVDGELAAAIWVAHDVRCPCGVQVYERIDGAWRRGAWFGTSLDARGPGAPSVFVLGERVVTVGEPGGSTGSSLLRSRRRDPSGEWVVEAEADARAAVWAADGEAIASFDGGSVEVWRIDEGGWRRTRTEVVERAPRPGGWWASLSARTFAVVTDAGHPGKLRLFRIADDGSAVPDAEFTLPRPGGEFYGGALLRGGAAIVTTSVLTPLFIQERTGAGEWVETTPAKSGVSATNHGRPVVGADGDLAVFPTRGSHLALLDGGNGGWRVAPIQLPVRHPAGPPRFEAWRVSLGLSGRRGVLGTWNATGALVAFFEITDEDLAAAVPPAAAAPGPR